MFILRKTAVNSVRLFTYISGLATGMYRLTTNLTMFSLHFGYCGSNGLPESSRTATIQHLRQTAAFIQVSAGPGERFCLSFEYSVDRKEIRSFECYTRKTSQLVRLLQMEPSQVCAFIKYASPFHYRVSYWQVLFLCSNFIIRERQPQLSW